MTTPTQKYLKSLRACGPSRAWVGDRDLQTAWNECENLEWMQWLVKREAWREYNRVNAQAWSEYERVTAAALSAYDTVDWSEYDRVTAPACAEYDRACKEALVEYERVTSNLCATCDKVRAMFECPGV